MPLFEVHFPPHQQESDATVRVEAENWLDALRAGMTKLGQHGAPSAHLLCDVHEDQSIRVTDPNTGRAFRIRELAAEAPAEPPPSVVVDPSLFRAPTPVAAPTSDRIPTKVVPVAAPTSLEPAAPISGLAEVEDVLAELFDRIPELWTKQDRRTALTFLLDLAMEKIPSEAGSVLLSSLSTGELSFATARGPKATELLRLGLRLPRGRGAAGVCVAARVGLAINDAQRDKRIEKTIGKQVEYETKNLLCAPAEHDGRVFGCIELLNRAGDAPFSPGELSILSYLASKAAEWLSTNDEK